MPDTPEGDVEQAPEIAALVGTAHGEAHLGERPHPDHPGDPSITQAYALGVPGCEGCEIAMMLEEIHSVWKNPRTPAVLSELIWAESDAYGEPGYVPPQGYDWSGIRDSSPEAIRRMYALLHA